MGNTDSAESQKPAEFSVYSPIHPTVRLKFSHHKEINTITHCAVKNT